MKKQYIIEKDQDGILKFTINRPETRNAINFDVMDGLQKAINLAKNDDVKLMIITGAGDKAFCSGGDLSIFHGLKTETESYAMLSKMSKILYSLLTLPKPTVALMNGSAVGGGCEIAVCCDFRVARDNVKAGFVQGNLAITTGWGGGTVLYEKLPQSIANEMLMGAKIYTVDELFELGFIDEIITETNNQEDLLANFVDRFINKQANVLSSYKKISIRKWELAEVERRIEQEVRQCAKLWEDDAHHKAVENFLQKK